tara:strand:+ start:1359 stop:2225 length:867 start_codon:yes stop_codon:yes gene_type:complete
MPELPEVEVVKRSLETALNKLKIKSIRVNNKNLRYKVDIKGIKRLIGLKILSIQRRSKYLLFFFEKGHIMLVHLGMTGKFILINKKNIKLRTSFYYKLSSKDNKHNHIKFLFSNETQLIYNDVRKFGFIKVENSKKLKQNFHLKTLGPEPLESIFNFRYFKNYLRGRNRIIKDLLMDQKFVSGLGNIYVNEILFHSRIKPTRKICKMKDFEIREVIRNIRKILKKAIKFGGSSIRDFSNSKGKIGSFQEHFRIYGMLGKNCSNSDCNYKIQKIVISNRASFLCPKCQK